MVRDDLKDIQPSFDIDTNEDSNHKGLTDGELSKLINADRAMLYRWRTGSQPTRPSKRYKEVMKDWEFKGDRWYRRHHYTQK